MSQANELLNSVTESTAGSAAEGHIVIGRDRYITVPDDLNSFRRSLEKLRFSMTIMSRRLRLTVLDIGMTKTCLR